MLAYIFSPRPLRHPYLLYASALVLGSQLAATDLLVPYLLALGPARPVSPSAAAAAAAQRRQKEKRQREREQRAAAARARMEASYEVLGGFDAHSEGSAEELEEEADVNGEQVRAQVEVFLQRQVVRGALAGLGFFLSVVGIWGDGIVAPVYGQVIIEV